MRKFSLQDGRVRDGWQARRTDDRQRGMSHSHPGWGRITDIESKPPPLSHPPTYSLVGAQGYQRFPLSKPGVGQNIALHDAPADRTSTCFVSAFQIHLTSFLAKLLRFSTVKYDTISESEFRLWKYIYSPFFLLLSFCVPP